MRLDLMPVARSHLLRRLMVWVLVVALPINSLSVILTQALGAQHSHTTESMDVDAAPSAWSPRTIIRAIVGDEAMALMDAYHAQEQTLHTLTYRTEPPHVHKHGAGGHTHNLLERHHHDPNDGSVIPLGSKETSQDTPGSSSTNADSGNPCLHPLASVSALPMPTMVATIWWYLLDVVWSSHVTAPLERPPSR